MSYRSTGKVKFSYVAGFLCNRDADGDVKRESVVTVDAVVERNNYRDGNMAILKARKNVIPLKDWERFKRTETKGFAGFSLSERRGEFEQEFLDAVLPLLIGTKRAYTVYQEGKIRIFAYCALFRKKAVIVYADSDGELKLSHGVSASQFIAEHSGKYILNQVHEFGGENLAMLEEEAVKIESDTEYKLKVSRDRMVAADCTVTDVRAEGLTVTKVLRSESGVCQVNPNVNIFRPSERINGTLLKVLDLSACKELRIADVFLENADSIAVLFPSEKPNWLAIRLQDVKQANFVNLSDVSDMVAMDSGMTGFPSRLSCKRIELFRCTGDSVINISNKEGWREKIQIIECDTERLSLTASSLRKVTIADCEKLEEVNITVEHLSLFDLDKFICNCRKLKKVHIAAKELKFREPIATLDIKGDAESLNEIMTASFGSTCLREFRLTVETVDSELDSKLNQGFIIAVPSEVDFQCSENIRKYFIGVRFSGEMRELLCALPSISLTYVKDKITLGFYRSASSVSLVNGFHNSSLFKDGTLEIPSEIECIGDSKTGFDSYFKIKSLVIKSPLEVGKLAFLGAEIEEIVGSENLTKIGEAAFANNSSLKSLALGDKARLSELSFDECSGLMSITGVERAKAISMSAFSGCYNINEEVREALRARGVYTDKLTLTHRLSDSAYKKFRSFCSGVSLTPSECVYLNEFIQKGVSKEEVSRVRDALRGKPADFKQLNELYIYYDGLVDVYTKGILSGIVEFGDHERTVYKFRKEFGILVQGYE